MFRIGCLLIYGSAFSGDEVGEERRRTGWLHVTMHGRSLRRCATRNAGLAVQYLTGAVFPETDARKLQVGGQMIVRALETVTHVDGDRFHAAYRKYGDLGAAAEELLQAANLASRHLRLVEIEARLDSLAAARTQVAKSARLVEALRSLFPLEAKYFIKLILGDMRTGVKQSLVEEAIALSTEQQLAAVRSAGMLLGDLAAVVNLARLNAAPVRGDSAIPDPKGGPGAPKFVLLGRGPPARPETHDRASTRPCLVVSCSTSDSCTLSPGMIPRCVVLFVAREIVTQPLRSRSSFGRIQHRLGRLLRKSSSARPDPCVRSFWRTRCRSPRRCHRSSCGSQTAGA